MVLLQKTLTIFVHLGILEKRSNGSVGKWIGPGVINALVKMKFPINKPVGTGKGTLTNGSKEEIRAYNTKWHREKRTKIAENKVR